MPEEESGFTFVDKRRVNAEADATSSEDVVEIGAGAGESSDRVDFGSQSAESESADAGGESVDVYDLITYCAQMVAAQSWLYLGLIADPKTGKTQEDLEQAKVAIDVFGDLAKHLDAAPDTALPAEAKRELRTVLNDLRLNYVARRGEPSPVIK